MNGYFVKDPAGVLDLSFDWSVGHLDPGESIATDLGWTVVPDDPPDGLAIQSNSQAQTTTTAFLSGGVTGDAYLVSSRVATDQGREIQRSIVVRIANS